MLLRDLSAAVISSFLSRMNKPKTWAEARKHPGILSIEYERPQGPWDPDMPWLVTLKDGWSFNEDTTVHYVMNLKDLRGLWEGIVNHPGCDD